VDAHEQFKMTIGEADKEFNSIMALIQEVQRICQQYGISIGLENPYSYITGQVRRTVIGCLHDPANVQQTFSKCIQNTRELLDVCWIV